MRFTCLVAAYLVFTHFAECQHRSDPVARAAGGVWLRNGGDPWCILGAAPILSAVSGPAAGFAHFPAPWGIAELSESAAVFALPAGPGVIGASLTRTGFDLFAETDLGVAFGGSAGALLYGVTARYRHLRIERYGSAGLPSVDASVVVVTGDWFRWGLRITDLNRPLIGNTGERLRETVSVAGLLSLPGAPHVSLELERDVLGSFSTRAGIVQVVGDLLAARFGMSSSFTRIHAGLEVTPGRIGIGYGVLVHPELGWSHSAWIGVALQSRPGR